MIHIELIGATSAGKSTLTTCLMDVCAQRHLKVTTSSDIILAAFGLVSLRNVFLRERIIDVAALLAYTLRWKRYRKLVVFSVTVISGLSIGRFGKLNTLRNLVRKAGIAELVRILGKHYDVVLVDNDGLLQAAHNLFVHTSEPPNRAFVSEFARLSATPDIALYLREDAVILERRTLKRGHKRIPQQSTHLTYLFVTRAVKVFEQLSSEPAVKRNLIVVGGRQRKHVRVSRGAGAGVRMVARLVRQAVISGPFLVGATTCPLSEELSTAGTRSQRSKVSQFS